MKTILACGEGTQDLGRTEWNAQTGEHHQLDGWMQPIIRKIIPGEIKIKTRLLKQIFLSPRPSTLKPIPKGHSYKAAMAKLIASNEGCSVVVFMTDADTNSNTEQVKKVKEIDDGFALIINDVIGVACVPQATSECWLLSDSEAWESLGLISQKTFPKVSPETLWGTRTDPLGHHPHQVFKRVSDEANLPDDRSTRVSVSELSSLIKIKQRCPASFTDFADKLAKL